MWILCLCGGRVGQIPSPYGIGGETGYIVPLIVTAWGREGQLRSGFSVSAFQDPPWFYLLFWPWVTTVNEAKFLLLLKIICYDFLSFAIFICKVFMYFCLLINLLMSSLSPTVSGLLVSVSLIPRFLVSYSSC